MTVTLDNGVELLVHDECQLLDYGESRSSGPYVKLRLPDPEYLAAFRGLDCRTAAKSGHILNVTICRGDLAEAAAQQPADDKPLYGTEANQLRRSGFFRIPDVWACIGSDEAFLDWLKAQPCAASTIKAHECDGDVVAAHVRRINLGAGISKKPTYSAIPLCNYHHQIQHHAGESAIAPKEWFDKQRVTYLEDWCWKTLKEELGYEHWNEVPPERLREWALVKGVHQSLPRCYKEAA